MKSEASPVFTAICAACMAQYRVGSAMHARSNASGDSVEELYMANRFCVYLREMAATLDCVNVDKETVEFYYTLLCFE